MTLPADPPVVAIIGASAGIGRAPDLVSRIDRAVADALRAPEVQEKIGRRRCRFPTLHFPFSIRLAILFVQTQEEAMIVWGAKGEVVNLGPQASKHCPTCERSARSA